MYLYLMLTENRAITAAVSRGDLSLRATRGGVAAEIFTMGLHDQDLVVQSLRGVALGELVLDGGTFEACCVFEG